MQLVHDYSEAFLKILLEKNGESYDTLLVTMRRVLKEKGHGRLLPHILKDVVQKLERAQKKNQTSINVSIMSILQTIVVGH